MSSGRTIGWTCTSTMIRGSRKRCSCAWSRGTVKDSTRSISLARGMAPLGITRPPSGCFACDGVATSVTVLPKLLHGEQCVAHTHWMSICVCPRRLHAHLTRSGTPRRGLRVLDRHELQPTTHSETWSKTRLLKQPPLGMPGECREALGHIL